MEHFNNPVARQILILTLAIAASIILGYGIFKLTRPFNERPKSKGIS
ncbi:MAG: hypothetical protein PHC64_04715 [Candidatus Gastranaerophilales bacterium]|nr:hypothetical protein [Candidatus Gastranaerophilales bacterium]